VRLSGIPSAESGSALNGTVRTAGAASSDGQHSQPDRREAGGSDRPSASRHQVDYSTPDEGAAINDADDNGAAVLDVGDLDPGAERQSAMSRGEPGGMGILSIGGLLVTVY
jgi:hypothetical protein